MFMTSNANKVTAAIGTTGGFWQVCSVYCVLACRKILLVRCHVQGSESPVSSVFNTSLQSVCSTSIVFVNGRRNSS